MSYIKKCIRCLFVGLLVMLAVYMAIRFDVDRLVAPYIITGDQLPQANITAMVLGAQVEHNTTPSPALAARLDTAISLYRSGRVSRLLMSGDGMSSPYYNEPKVMRKYVVSAGIPEDQVDSDPNGLRTYDSCYRLLYTYHYDRAVIITQPDHLKRAVYTCRSLGVDVVGVQTAPGSSWKSDPSFFIHEQGAIVLAWVDIHILHPVPKP